MSYRPDVGVSSTHLNDVTEKLGCKRTVLRRLRQRYSCIDIIETDIKLEIEKLFICHDVSRTYRVCNNEPANFII